MGTRRGPRKQALKGGLDLDPLLLWPVVDLLVALAGWDDLVGKASSGFEPEGSVKINVPVGTIPQASARRGHVEPRNQMLELERQQKTKCDSSPFCSKARKPEGLLESTGRFRLPQPENRKHQRSTAGSNSAVLVPCHCCDSSLQTQWLNTNLVSYSSERPSTEMGLTGLKSGVGRWLLEALGVGVHFLVLSSS